jgi:hypothetical protein
MLLFGGKGKQLAWNQGKGSTSEDKAFEPDDNLATRLRTHTHTHTHTATHTHNKTKKCCAVVLSPSPPIWCAVYVYNRGGLQPPPGLAFWNLSCVMERYQISQSISVCMHSMYIFHNIAELMMCSMVGPLELSNLRSTYWNINSKSSFKQQQ